MLKILHLLNFAGQGGTERYIRNFVQRLNGSHIRAYFAYNQPGQLLDWMESWGVPTLQLEMTGPFDFAAARKLAAFCRENGIEVIHTHYLRENYIALLAKRYCKGLRVVNTYHILTHDSFAVKLCNRLMCRKLDCQIANCTAGAARLAENGVSKKKIKLLYNAVEPEQWKLDGESTLRRELSASEDEFIMLYAARFVQGKGHIQLLEAVRQLKLLTDKPFRLVLAGDGELLEQIKDAAKDMQYVAFLGYRKDMANLYNGADLTVCPSENETLSLLLLESMAAGTPVLATAVGGITDIVTEENGCGLLVQYGRPEQMAQAMLRFMCDEQFRQSCAAAGEKTVREKFSLDAVSGTLMKIYSGEIK